MKYCCLIETMIMIMAMTNGKYGTNEEEKRKGLGKMIIIQ